jgi:hypothetical protein
VTEIAGVRNLLERNMPIRVYLGGRAFDPETIQHMSTAFRSVCDALDLRPLDDAVTRLVAEKIIALVESGVHSSTALHAIALIHFKPVDMPQQATLSDGSELVDPIRCDQCDALAYLVLSSSTRTFQCPDCGYRVER